jgi:tetratricopeptide (TPR) repeat protein
MVSILSPGEEAQLTQTVEMFEIITQTQPQDYQSLEILKEAYSKLGREKDVISTSKRIAQAYVHLGQLSSAILEYETILQLYPDDPDVKAALAQIETEANNFPAQAAPTEPLVLPKTGTPGQSAQKAARKASPSAMDDGRNAMHRVFVESKVITAGDFDLCWPTHDVSAPPDGVIEPFIQRLADKGVLPVEKSLKLLTDKARAAYLPLDKYDVDLDLARSFPAVTCQRWCVLPFDRMSKSVLVATANPFNQQAANELSEATRNRVVWYLVTPIELVKNLRKAFH